MDNIEERIAGEIAMAESAGSSMKKWRELFGISQVELAKFLKISASTISDYEGNRRVSPGVGIIKRFVKSLLTLDEQKGSEITRNLQKFNAEPKGASEGSAYSIKDFSTPISGMDFSRLIEAKIAANPGLLDTVRLFGYTMIDSLKIILEMSPNEYPKLFGNTTERVFIFDQVSTGRSPMVVIRVAPIKPKMVVIQNVDTIDKLAVKIAQIEKIPLLTTKLSAEEIRLRLSNI
jgi:putative transcriptional regulator